MSQKVEIQRIYPLTPMQESMLFHAIMDESNAYIEQISFDAIGDVSIEAFEQSFNLLIARYDGLRTVFKYKNVARPIQIVLKKRKAKVQFHSLKGVEDSSKASFIQDLLEKERQRKFDLTKDIPMRITVIQLEEQVYKMIWCYHHIMMDGWCLSLLFKDFLELYQSTLQGYQPTLSPVYPFHTFVDWLEKQDTEEAQHYWKKHLEGFEQISELPGKRFSEVREPEQNTQQHDSLSFQFSEQDTRALEDLARRTQVTTNSILQAVWGVLLGRYNHTHDVAFGVVVSGRPPEIVGIESMIGLFINTVPMRVEMSGSASFIEVVEDMQRVTLEAQRYAHLSLSDIQSQSLLKQNVIDHIMAFENYPIQEQMQQGESSTNDALTFEIDNVQIFEQTNYDFNIIISPGMEMQVKFSFNTAVYERSFIQQIGGHVQQIIKTILGQPNIRIDEIPIVTEEEEAVLRGFHTASLDGGLGSYPRNKLLPELFAEQVALRPDALAVVQGERGFTYMELEEESDRLAQRLIQQGIQRGERVGLMAGRSADMVVGMLGIVKAGGAYLSLEAGLPEERKQYMLQDGGVRWIVVSEALRQGVPAGAVALVLGAEEEESGASRGEDRGVTLGASNVQASLSTSEAVAESAAGIAGERISKGSAEQVAYVMYTSGSTGTPKGVMVTHRNVVRLVKQSNYVQLEAGDRLLQTGASGFDANTFEVWGTLLNGLTVYFVEDDILLETERLGEALQAYQISTMWLTSPLFNQLAQQKPSIFQGMKQLLVGGDVLSPVHIEQVRQACPSLTVINGYGPTENTTFSVCYRVEPGERIEGAIPIGYPISHSSAYILNEQQQLKPIGVAGELCVGGDGVALGYLNQAPLTKERFVPDPFLPEGRMYRTGDLARWLPDGRIEYLGRMDQQVKLRGYRVETGEVESQLLKLAGVRDAVVLVREHGGEKQLCAYYVADQDLDVAELKAKLKAKLPDYMIPTLMMSMEKLPLTANGKIDRAQLPEPDRTQLAWSEEPPAGEVEERLAQLWQDVLGVEHVGRGDHFFEMGGHSLKATQLLTRIHKEFQVEVPLRSIFKASQFIDMAKAIEQASLKEKGVIPNIESRSEYRTSPAQKQILAIQQMNKESISYNIPWGLFIKGELKHEDIEEILKKLIQRHEAFRTSFLFKESGPVQIVQPNASFTMEYIELDEARDDQYPEGMGEEEIDQIFESFVRPFDVSQAPLLRAGLVKCAENKHFFMCDMHHLISDGTSMSILLEELTALCNGESVPPLRIQYKDYAEWQEGRIQSGDFQEQKAYWQSVLGGDLPELSLPTDFSRPQVRSFAGDRVEFMVDQDLTQKLHSVAQATRTTLFSVLLASLNILLHRYSGQRDIIVGSPVAGRTHSDLERVIGMFVNTLAFRTHLAENISFQNLLQTVQMNVVKGLENQEYPLDKVIKDLSLSVQPNRNPLFDVVLVLQNMTKPAGQIQSLQFESYEFNPGTAKFDLTLQAIEQDGQLACTFEFSTDLFKRETVTHFSADFIRILEQISSNPEIELQDIQLEKRYKKLKQVIKEDVSFKF
ncbi:non-ribosomal peptide synthetase [Bacillus horti]|uniref:Amino acid adenylation domain-containing protein n=1 Tax=Caldalkalibacillus horti TaxID=77523 RepID=A0ABT9W540_9BACI|nr:non-ribosomal peptide synthetase [Bacillus horti]MDQ0168367.1 amino acid adenylation domain-containing protein [Bacillus horti]